MKEIEIPQIAKNCKICGNELRFAIQKDLDMGLDLIRIEKKYGLDMEDTQKHITGNHRIALITHGQVDYILRKKAIDIGESLAEFIDKWSANIKIRTPETIKDADAIRAMELYLKSRGELTEKREITVKRSIEEALGAFLGEPKLEDEVKE